MGSLPSVIGPYRIVRQLGEGGMGAVYEAVHEVIQRRVAIKVLHPEAGHSVETINRFINEARAANLVDHPGLVQITDFGNLPDGSGYLVMEYLKGETLSERLAGDGGKLSPSETVQIGSQIAAAVAAVHKKSIIHRDLKPSNVMLVPEPAMPTGERVKVLDFGLAKLSEARTAAAVKTHSQAVMGTPLYMSPEQCEGAGRVDARSDVYSLGCMLYEMLSGQPPFSGEGPGQVLGQHMFKQPKPLRTVVPATPPHLADLVDRLLVKPKEKRPSMREVQKALEALAAELPPPSRRQEPEGSEVIDATRIAALGMASTLGRAASETRRPQHRTRLLVGLAGMTVAATLTGALIWPSGSPRPAKPPVVAVRPVVPPPPPVPLRPVTLRVLSQPPGAQIVDVTDGKLLGATPWLQEMPRSDEPLRIKLRLNKYTERELLLSRQRDDAADITLVAAREPRGQQANKSPNPSRPAHKTPTTPSARGTHDKPIFD